MRSLGVTLAGIDNGSGVLEAGGWLGVIQIDEPLGIGRAVIDLFLSDVDNRAEVAVENLSMSKLGSHYIVSFTTREPTCGEQHFLAVATDERFTVEFTRTRRRSSEGSAS